MTAIKASEEHRTILDFSNGAYSKNKIKHLLQQCQVSTVEGTDYMNLVFVDNLISVGMYTVQLHLSTIICFGFKTPRKLKEFGGFCVSISEDDGKSSINLSKDKRFRDQYWLTYNSSYGLRTKHLVDIINHCARLDRLCAYL